MKKLFAIFLVLCLLVSAVPVAAVEAVTTEAQPQMESQPVSVESADPAAAATPAAPVASSEVTVVREEESLRGEYEKHFLMSDGSYQAVVYSYPVHELVDGVWVELPAPEQTARGDVSPGNAQQNIIDNYVWQNHGVQDNNSVRLYIGKRSGNECRAFIRFATMPTIPAGATITAATMKVNMVSGTSTAYNAKVSQVTGSWESATIQWSNMPTIGAVLENNISHNNKTKYEFSCLAAVQHWYANSTTGQNENYGIMLQYADSTIADYNSFYSADCTDATMRPSMTIRYDPLSNVVEIKEGETRTLSVPGYTGTITWTTDDAAIATVSAEGVVTGINAGETMVTALAGNEVLAEYTAYVSISEGTYYIRSTYGVYMGTSGQIADGTGAYLFAKATSGRAQLNQLWRIDYLGTGYYSIRPLYNMNMGLCSENGVPGDAVITNIGASDKLADVPATNRWSISRTANGLEFYCAGTSYMTLCADQPYTGAKVVTKTGTTNLSGCYWSLEQVTNIPIQILLLDKQTGASVSGNTKYIDPGETVSLSDLGFLATVVCVGRTNQRITITVSGSPGVNYDASAGTITGITGNSEVEITYSHTHYAEGTFSASFYLCAYSIVEGEYYIRNWSTDKYVDINDTASSSNDICQSTFHGGNAQRWVFTRVDFDIYTIHTSNDATQYYLGVVGDSPNANAGITFRIGTITDGMKWKVEITESGAFKLTALVSVSNNCVLSLGQQHWLFGEDGRELQQKTYTQDNNFEDEWLLSAVSDEYVAEGQETDVWCWAASARIAASKTMISHISQASAAVYTKQTVRTLQPTNTQITNSTDVALPKETAKALEYITGRTDVFYYSGKIYEEDTLRALLDYSVPIIICRGWYFPYGRDGGHVTVICGYSWDSAEQAYKYRIIDPGTENGEEYYRSYAWICNGNNGTAGYDVPDPGIWDSVVGFKVGDYSDTIDYSEP